MFVRPGPSLSEYRNNVSISRRKEAWSRTLFERQQGINIQVSTIQWTNVGSMLDHRLQRWTNIETTLGQCILFVESALHTADI